MCDKVSCAYKETHILGDIANTKLCKVRYVHEVKVATYHHGSIKAMVSKRFFAGARVMAPKPNL